MDETDVDRRGEDKKQVKGFIDEDSRLLVAHGRNQGDVEIQHGAEQAQKSETCVCLTSPGFQEGQQGK